MKSNERKSIDKWYTVDMWDNDDIVNRMEFEKLREATEYYNKIKYEYDNIEVLEWEKSYKMVFDKLGDDD